MTHYAELAIMAVCVLLLLRWFKKNEPKRPDWQRRQKHLDAVTAAHNDYLRRGK